MTFCSPDNADVDIVQMRYSDPWITQPDDWQPHSPEERHYLGSLAPWLRDRYVFRRRVLARQLAERHACPPSRLQFTHGENQQPRYAPPHGLPHFFSIADTEDVFAFAVCRIYPVGIDIERISPELDIDAALDLIASPTELALFSNLSADARRPAFFCLWTRKEALLKGMGEGFLADPRRFTVMREGTKQAAFLAHEEGRETAWEIKDIPCFDRHHASVAICRS